MPETFSCPSCHAPLSLSHNHQVTVHCDYCNNTVIVPEEMRSRTPHIATLFQRQNNLGEIVRLINDGHQQQATYLYHQSFGVNQAEAQEAVQRLAAGLGLAANLVQVQHSRQLMPIYREKDNTGRVIGCLVISFILFILITVLLSVVLPLIFTGFTLWSIFS